MEFKVKRVYFHAASVFLSHVLVAAEGSDRDLELLQITKNKNTKKQNRSLWRTKALQRSDFCSFTLSVNLIGLIFILKWFSAASGAVWGLTVSPFVEAVHWNDAFSVSTNCFLSHYPAPGYHYRPALAFVFLQLKNDLFSSDNDTTSSRRFTYSRLRLNGWNIYLFWHTSVWNESKNKLFNWRYWLPCLQRRTELPWQHSLNAPHESNLAVTLSIQCRSE